MTKSRNRNARSGANRLTSVEHVAQSILILRGRKILLDTDLAMLYGVPTKRFNEAVKRNRQRFPGDFAFQLTTAEFVALRSPATAGNSQTVDIKSKKMNWSQIQAVS